MKLRRVRKFRLNSLKSRLRTANGQVAIACGISAFVIGAILLSAHAATSQTAVEPEKGTITGAANSVADSSASGGKAVMFGSGGTGTGSLPAGIFVAPNGNDSTGDGSISKPFATLGRAQTAMRAGGPQITYIRAGTYKTPAVTSNGVTYALYLTKADNGQTWSYYPPDGYNSAILDGGSTTASTGIKEMITIDGGSNITIDGLDIRHFKWIGVSVHGGGSYAEAHPINTTTASGNVVKNNLIHDGGYDTSVDSGYGFAAIEGSYAIPSTTFSHNAIYNIMSSGINLTAGGKGGGGTLSNLVYDGNVVLNTCLDVTDCAALYTQDINLSSTNIRITNNYVRDAGTAASQSRAIYLDDGSSNTLVSGNIVSGLSAWMFTIHGGKNDTFTGNIVDLATYDNAVLLYQGSSVSTVMSGNSVTNNIIISGGGGDGYRGMDTFQNQPVIKNNAYYTYAGSQMSTGGIGMNGDASPVIVNPQLSCWAYNIAAGSPVFNAPVSFKAIEGNWGPPGYVIPKTGTPPSQPHGC
ncbi:MAG TPA: right-handed parallel beta-helix repeat-containing protein [Candidatus Saccharimonadales bacterium]|nr:right-handed parallel beta-helix repeat-containing protein [Candidatus Saccharimonadales bacterium]